MLVDDALQQARTRFDRRAWREAYVHFSAADGVSPLEPDDVDRLGTCAYLLGNETEGLELLSRAHHGFLQRGHARRAFSWVVRG